MERDYQAKAQASNRDSSEIQAEATPHRFTFPSGQPRTSEPSQLLPSPPCTPPRRLHRHTQSLAVPSSPLRLTSDRPSTPSTLRPSTPKYQDLGIGPPPLQTPTRCRPTLAMSIQLHQPTPSSSQAQYPASPASSRRHSSQYPQQHQQPQPHPHAHAHALGAGIERPPSRSERLLRDTLRRDSEHGHVQARPAMHTQVSTPALSPRSPRAHTRQPSYTPSYEDDAQNMVLARPNPAAGLTRNKSAGHVPRRASTSTFAAASQAQLYAQQYAQQQQQQQQQQQHYPAPGRQQRQRDTSPSPVRHRPSASTSGSGSGSSLAQSVSRSRSHSVSTGAGASLTPHEAVLRARLEKVLAMGREMHHHHHHQHPAQSQSQSSLSPEEWISSDDNVSEESSSPPTSGGHSPPLPASHLPSHPHTHNTHTHRRTSRAPRTPMTPPDSPHAFDAKAAGAACRQMEGYVSFAHVAGLGEPDADSSEDEIAGGAAGIRGGLERLWKVWGREREGRA